MIRWTKGIKGISEIRGIREITVISDKSRGTTWIVGLMTTGIIAEKGQRGKHLLHRTEGKFI